MTASKAPPLHDPIDPAVAARRLADWGFMAHADLPDGRGDAYLLVGLRDAPTLHHFDPEIAYVWVSSGSRGTRLEITRKTRPLDTTYSWGTVVIVDRLGVANEYVTFGGHLTSTPLDDLTVVVLVSPAPILRRGGHSQGWDEAAVDLAGFFGRLMIAVDYRKGFEAQLTAAEPVARYAAFIADVVRRFRASIALRGEHPTLWTLVRNEQERLQVDHRRAWDEGVALLAAAALGTGTAPHAETRSS